jgi:hypothetical protein
MRLPKAKEASSFDLARAGGIAFDFNSCCAENNIQEKRILRSSSDGNARESTIQGRRLEGHNSIIAVHSDSCPARVAQPESPSPSYPVTRVTETRMETVQASRTIPLRPQWAWHYLCDVLRWDVFLPFVNEVRRLEGQRFEFGSAIGRDYQMKLSLREPTERLEWVTTDPCFVGGTIIVERLGFRTGVTVLLHLDDVPLGLETVQAELDAGLDRLVVHLSDREPLEHGTEATPGKPLRNNRNKVGSSLPPRSR